MVATGFILASLVAFVAAKPVARSLAVHEQRTAVPSTYVQAGPAAGSTVLNLRLALAETNTAGLIDALYDVSTPSSSNYGQHLSKAEVEKFVSPSQQSVDAVNAWLAENNITSSVASPAGDWLAISIPVEEANTLLDADFTVFTHEETGKQVVRTLSYSIPEDLKQHLDLVHPTVSFPNPLGGRPTVSTSVSTVAKNITSDAVPTSCKTTVTPACLQALYGIPTTAATESSNSIAVAGFIEQYANTADLKTFLKKFRTDMSSATTFTLAEIDGGKNTQSSVGIEANLDVQYTVGVATDVPVSFISVGEDFDDGDLEGFLDIVNYLLAMTTTPQVMTTSYGQNENTMSLSLAVKLCNAYAQLGARGTSILFASGDGGVSGSQSASCSKFVPTFPSGCPYLTSVGATTGISPETAATFSAGGFSNYWGTPDYQTAAAKTYLGLLGSTNSGKFNTSGRGYPDVSAQGQTVDIVASGSTETVSGTSCSSPIFASVIGLLNDQLIAAGQSPLGFLNPWLYANPSMFTDVTTGDNPGCSTNGFPAKAGWDPVTGLGTPIFAKMATAAGL